MPTRLVRDGYLGSERVASLNDFGAETLYFRLFLCVDDFGRFDARPLYVVRHAFPMHDAVVNTEMVRKWLLKLASARLILLYDVGGKPFLYLAKFRQRLRAQKSKCPAPPTDQVAVIEADEDYVGEGDPAPSSKRPPKVDRKAALQAQAEEIVTYLNTLAGTQYQLVEGTVKFPRARLAAGATLEQLRAVVDAKVRQAMAGEFKRDWLQPSTLFNDAKFAQYMGQLRFGVMEKPGDKASKDIVVLGFKEGTDGAFNLGKKVLNEGDPKPAARDIADAFWSSASRQKAVDFACTSIGVKIPGEALVKFAVQELNKEAS